MAFTGPNAMDQIRRSYLTFLSVMCWMFINTVLTLVYVRNPVPHYDRVHSLFQINISQNLSFVTPFFHKENTTKRKAVAIRIVTDVITLLVSTLK
jgi:hypothetical protein